MVANVSSMLLMALLKAVWSIESSELVGASIELVVDWTTGSWIVLVETDIIRRDSSVSNMRLLL